MTTIKTKNNDIITRDIDNKPKYIITFEEERLNMRTLLRNIKNCIGNSTALNFHIKVTTCLKLYCRHRDIDFKCTKQMGGDGGVDFLIENSNTYFAISGSVAPSLTSILSKLEHDLSRMKECVLEHKEYTGKIDEFIFIFNTFNDEKPNDREKKIDELFNKYSDEDHKFKYKIWNVDDFVFELEKRCDDKLLKIISEELNIFDIVNSPLIIDQIRDVLNKVEDSPITTQNFNRKSTKEKINNNNLEIMSYEINNSLTDIWYSKLEDVIQEPEYNKKFLSFKDAVVEFYNSQKSSYNGSELFEIIISNISRRYNCSNNVSKLLAIYLFDRCDIF